MQKTMNDQESEVKSMKNNQINDSMKLIDHPLFANTKLQMIVAERTAQAMSAMEEARAEQPGIGDAELLTNAIAGLLAEGRMILSREQLKNEIDHVVMLTRKTMSRLNEAEKNGREQLAQQLSAYGEEQLQQLLAVQYQLYLHNVEKAKAADRETAGAANPENPENILSRITDETRANAAAIHPAIVAGADIRLGKDIMTKMISEYTAVNNMYAMIYLSLDAGVVMPDGSVASLSECDPQETVYIPMPEESFARQAVMNAVLMNLRKNEYALNEREDFTSPDKSIPKDISDEDLCFWFACKDRLVGGCCRFAAGDGGAVQYVLNLLGAFAALAVVLVGFALAVDILASTAVIDAICAGLTKTGLLSLFGAEAVKSAVMQFITGLGITDNVIGFVLMIIGGVAIEKTSEHLDEKYPLAYKETQQAKKLRKLFIKRKAVDVNDSLKSMYAAAEEAMKAEAADADESAVEVQSVEREQNTRASEAERENRKMRVEYKDRRFALE